jgi:ubiquinone/menaquinone biosynthesis C-methylase UbiE
MPNSNKLLRKFNSNETQQAYAKIAWFYDFWGRLTESKANRKVLELADIKNREYILEAAVGTGRLFEQIVQSNSGGFTVGFDLTPAMLRKARHRFSQSDGIQFSLEIANTYQLPYTTESFDLLINNFMLDLLPENDYSHILSEFNRVLKPGGHLLISTMAFGPRWYHRFWAWLAATFPSLLTNCRPVQIGEHLKQSGFENIQSFFISQNTFPSLVWSSYKKMGDKQ